MLVVVVAVRHVAVRAVEVVDVIAVRDCLVTAALAVGVLVVHLGGDMGVDLVLVVVTVMLVVTVAVMQVVDMALMLDGDVVAVGAVGVGVFGVDVVGDCHGGSLSGDQMHKHISIGL